MLIQRYIAQPAGGSEYASLFSLALRQAEFASFDGAVAYATLEGIKSLEASFADNLRAQWLGLRKRWLTGIDWCRTEPVALERLSSLDNSVCRIHDGTRVVRQAGCFPILPFHPKTFILQGEGVVAVIVGSGNLSRNGLTKGHEVGSLLLVNDPVGDVENHLWENCQQVARWFQGEWREGTPLRNIQQAYARQYKNSQHLRRPTPTDDDAADSSHLSLSRPRRALTPEKLGKLRACEHLWIEAGNLHENRGPGRPGNQLMLSPMTRVFFGFRAKDIQPDTHLGYVSIRYRNHLRNDCSLRFSNNSMDVLTLPLPGQQGPNRYDRKTLMFKKMPDETLSLRVGTREQIRRWQQASRAIDGFYSMTSGRQWGVF